MKQAKLYLSICLLLFANTLLAQTRITKDKLEITLPEFNIDSSLVEHDTIPPDLTEGLVIIDDDLDFEADSFIFKSILDTLPNGEIRIDYKRLPPRVFMLIAARYAPKPMFNQQMSPQLDKYFRSMNLNMTVGGGVPISDLLNYLLSPTERRKMKNKKNDPLRKYGDRLLNIY